MPYENAAEHSRLNKLCITVYEDRKHNGFSDASRTKHRMKNVLRKHGWNAKHENKFHCHTRFCFVIATHFSLYSTKTQPEWPPKIFRFRFQTSIFNRFSDFVKDFVISFGIYIRMKDNWRHKSSLCIESFSTRLLGPGFSKTCMVSTILGSSSLSEILKG